MSLDRRRHCEGRCRISRALPAVPLGEARLGAVTPRDDEGLDPPLVLGPGPEERGSLRRAEPLVAVAGVDVRPELLEVERQLSGSVCAVNDREHAGCARSGTDLLDRKDKRSRRGDVADRDRLRPRADRTRELARLCVDELRSHELPGARHRSVLVARRQHLVLRAEAERADDGVQPCGGVRNEHEVLGSGADESGKRRASLGQQIVEAATEKLRGVPLELALQLLVAGEHGYRTRSVAPVVEIDDTRIEQKLHAATVSRCGTTSGA